MSAPPPAYRFFTELARILNAGQSRSVLLCGNVNDLYFSPTGSEGGHYVPLIPFLFTAESDLWAVVSLHESGHMFGMPHSFDGSVMNPNAASVADTQEEVDNLGFSPYERHKIQLTAAPGM